MTGNPERTMWDKWYTFPLLWGCLMIVAIIARSSPSHAHAYIFGGSLIAVGVAMDIASLILIVRGNLAAHRNERPGPSPLGIVPLFWYGAGLWVVWPHVTREDVIIVGASLLAVHITSYFIIPLFFMIFTRIKERG